MEEKLIQFLKESYNAKAIMLHGSRARGNFRPNSDWDLLVFTDKIVKEGGGIHFEGFELDIRIITLPIKDLEKTIQENPQTFETRKILLDNEEGILEKLNKVAEQVYSKRKELSSETKQKIKAHLNRMILRLEDNIDNQEAFFYRLAEFYMKTIRYWFEYKGMWSQPIYMALPIFKKEAPEFLKHIQILSENSTNIKKIDSCKKMREIVLT